ncbi:phosphatase PAP2 family protein [Acetobacter musti]|uniref:phosphatase PAP2 family protein n=1 Tax=Acetobacter musti TaxID=864732 RepID=UPI00156BA9FB
MDGLKLNIIVQCALVIATALVFLATGTTLTADRGFPEFFLLLYGLLFIAAYIVRSRVLTLACQGLIFYISAGFCAGFAALAALRTEAPLADTRLDGWDHHLGIHTEHIFTFFAPFDAFNSVLGEAYRLTVPCMMVTIIVLALRQDAIGLYRMCFIFSVSAFTCALFNLFFPALDTVLYHHLSSDLMKHFPAGAGVDYGPPFEAWHSRRLSAASPSALSGVVAFPSLHVVMALTELAFLKINAVFNSVVFICVLLVLLSTILIGGHYVSDIIGGAFLFYGVSLLSERIVR